MSKTIDERVVEMRFDNKQFESNVQTSLSTIEKLKKSLDMDGATKGLESIDSAAKKVDMSGLGSAVETVKTRFSALEIMAVTALANITNSVVNTGKQMLRSLTIEPISQGFEEYELKMGSIQTIMMSTGASLEEVNKYLQELNTYSDKTIYSFQDSYASLPGRGAHKGKQVIEKWIRTDSKNCKYVLKMDIRHFFDSIPHDRLKAKLKKTVHDEKMLELLFRIIDVTEVGIPLGFYTSQWLSNWYLQGLDHFIKEQLCAVHYMRYMDDMVVFGSNKRVLHRMRQAISDYLEMELGLELKANWQVFRFSYGNNQGRDLDFMGFRFYRNRTILRKSIMYKATRKARKISKKEKATILDARQMLSYLGWIDCTDTYLMYRKWIKPCVSFQQLKRKVSRYDKYDEKRVYQKLVSLYTAKGGKSHGVKLQICREHSPTDCT